MASREGIEWEEEAEEGGRNGEVPRLVFSGEEMVAMQTLFVF